MTITDITNKMIELIVENGCNYCGRYADSCEKFNLKHCRKCDEFELAGNVEEFAQALISKGVHIYSHRTDEKQNEKNEKMLERVREAIRIANWHRYDVAETIVEELNLDTVIFPPHNVKVGDTIYFIEHIPYFQKKVICSDTVIGFTDKGFLLKSLKETTDDTEHELFPYERNFYLSHGEASKELKD